MEVVVHRTPQNNTTKDQLTNHLNNESVYVLHKMLSGCILLISGCLVADCLLLLQYLSSSITLRWFLASVLAQDIAQLSQMFPQCVRGGIGDN